MPLQPSLASVPPKPRQVLIWSTPTHLTEKDPHTGYCIPHGSAVLEAIGRKTGAFHPIVSDDLSVYLPENIRGFEAIVMKNSSDPRIAPTNTDLAKPFYKPCLPGQPVVL